MSSSKTRMIETVQKELDTVQEMYRDGRVNLEEKLVKMLSIYQDLVESKIQKQIAEYLTTDNAFDAERTDIDRAYYLLGKEQFKKEVKQALNFYLIVKETVVE